MPNTYLKIGTTFRVFDDSVTHFDHLPVATYVVEFDPNSGFSLRATDDLTAAGRLYGNHAARVDRIMRTYQRTDRSLGVLLTGDKGMGKSLLIRLLAGRALQAGVPVIRVTRPAPGIADFLDSLGEVMVVLDEFEKVFPLEDADCMSQQDQFLPLFDGLSEAKRLYAVSANQTRDLSDYLLNRPGRFHYHLQVSYPTPDECRAYLTDQAPSASVLEVDKVVALTHRMPMNYDHLRAVAFEMESGEPLESFINDLNIKRSPSTSWRFTVHVSDGTAVHSYHGIDASSPEERAFVSVSPSSSRWVTLNMERATHTPDGGLSFATDAFHWQDEDEDTARVTRITARLTAHTERLLG